jgi:electron transfer flavoprotein beta subunit
LQAEVVVCSFGIESAAQVIKEGLSKGADKGILIGNDSDNEYDILNISKIFKKVLIEENFDLILSGLQSDDIGNGQLGVLLSEHLNFSHASLVMETNISDTDIIKVKRELETNHFQVHA